MATGICTALNLSDEKPCHEIATSINGLFCHFHSRQCQGLYRGYKRRNAQLDRLSESPPQFLADSKTPLINQLFSEIDSEEWCKEIHDYLFQKLQLLNRVIAARKLHHSRFYSMNYDYGHIDYLNQLQTQRTTVTRALERIERRTAEILYQNQKWFKWVRECQDEEEAHREKEQKKVKQEAALFRRHWKEVQQRLEELRVQEWQKKQEIYLDNAYKESLTDEEDDGVDWDPIDDVVEDNRENFIDLIKRFLWMPEAPKEARNSGEDSEETPKGDGHMDTTTTTAAPDISSEAQETDNGNGAKTTGTKSKKSKASKKKKTKASSQASNGQVKAVEKQKSPQECDKSLIETKEEMYDRLRNGAKYEVPGMVGVMTGGTHENPVIDYKTATYPEKKVQKLLAEITEIKYLLFCRLLLGHATLLPAALRAETVEAFLADPEVTEAALRDLCLKMENPKVQDIRDACADLFRSQDEEEEISETEAGGSGKNESVFDEYENGMMFEPKRPADSLPTKWVSESEKEREKARLASQQERERLQTLAYGVSEKGGLLDFGEIKDADHRSRKMIRVKICGRTIWNYPSKKAMNRRGWLHFCLIAKDSSLHEAIGLCRHWDEFYALNVLAIWDYFPSTRWAKWVGYRYRRQLLELGFIVYCENVETDAKHTMQMARTGPNSEKFRRAQATLQARNWMCAYMKRDDPITRRLIQYLSMNSECFLLVRDAETGTIIVKPPEEERWLLRGKSLLGRSQNTWNNIQEVGPKFFEEMDKHRKWNFSFKEYYDVYVWDVAIGEPFAVLHNTVQDTLIKAHRCRGAPDLHNMAAPILRELTWSDYGTKRICDLEPGNPNKKSVFDVLNSEDTKIVIGKVDDMFEAGPIKEVETRPRWFYNDADAMEDEVLFPEEKTNTLALGKITAPRIWEEEGFSYKRFLERLEASDSEFDSEEESTADEDEDADEDEYEDEDDDEDDDDVEYVFASELDEYDSDDPSGSRNPFEAQMNEFTNMSPAARNAWMENFQLKEMASIFKESWHKADLSQNAQQHYVEMLRMGKAARKHASRLGIMGPQSILGFKICRWIDPQNSLDKIPEDQKDIMKAVEKLSPFFLPSFVTSKEGQKFKDSLLLRQEERAKHFPEARSNRSNTEQPKEFWTEWDKVKKSMKHLEDVPFEWDVAIRPIIAHLYKSDVIRMKKDELVAPGQAIAAKEASRTSMDLFIDYRLFDDEVGHLVNPATIPALRTTAYQFSQKNPQARFAILRMWSAPYFWPLMIGPESRQALAFQDLIGRNFIWLFLPKDMGHSERSAHFNCSNRILPYKKLFKENVVVKKDLFLVMGEDEQELEKLATAVTFAIQKKPWRLEVDLWKSFVNVDYKFLENLPGRWFE